MTENGRHREADPDRPGRIYLIDPSKRCEPSAFLFTKAVNFLLVNGYRIAEAIHESDTIMVNTCCVTEDKIASSLAALAFARSHGKGKRIVMFGCAASLPLSGLDRQGLFCIGPKNLDELNVLFPHHTPVSRIAANRLSPELYAPGQGLGFGDYFILIAQGCSNRCSYCNIKRTKGDIVSEPVDAILSQVRRGLSLGVKEFTLVADDCASYGPDLGTDLVQLMKDLFAAGPAFGLKLGYLYPAYLLRRHDELRALFRTGRIRYVNIPVQSGSQRILDLMNRPYPINEVAAAVRLLREDAPGTTFCTHIMVNFPTESHAEFLQSLALAKEFDEVLFLNYSDNRDTAAAALHPKVPEQEVRRRLDLASDYANSRTRGRSAVIKDFNCEAPYNIQRAFEG